MHGLKRASYSVYYVYVCTMYAEQAPTDLMVRQIGINRVRVSWTPPPNPPSRGYMIIIGDTRPTDFSAGIKVLFGASSYATGQPPGTLTYWLVTLYGTPIVIGPVSCTVRGEEKLIM